MKRLRSSQTSRTGSDFKIAMKDMEVRGGEPPGGRAIREEIYSDGFDMYMRLLEEARQEALGGGLGSLRRKPYLELEYSGFIPMPTYPCPLSRWRFTIDRGISSRPSWTRSVPSTRTARPCAGLIGHLPVPCRNPIPAGAVHLKPAGAGRVVSLEYLEGGLPCPWSASAHDEESPDRVKLILIAERHHPPDGKIASAKRSISSGTPVRLG
jgi:hypothetical protein